MISLDVCPKCGKNVCSHTSIADIIHLPNSVSQDFSTYSSDSSLIRTIFDFNLLPQTNNNSKIKNIQQRPLSCQFVIIDNQTTDRLLKEFFDNKYQEPWHSSPKLALLDKKSYLTSNKAFSNSILTSSRSSNVSSSDDTSTTMVLKQKQTSISEEDEEATTTITSTSFETVLIGDNKTQSSLLQDYYNDDNTNFNNSTSTIINENYIYHSNSILFILLSLFIINLIQEIFILFYYFNTKQLIWLITSVIVVYCGHILISIHLVLQNDTRHRLINKLIFLIVPDFIVVFYLFVKHVLFGPKQSLKRYKSEFNLAFVLSLISTYHSLPILFINVSYVVTFLRDNLTILLITEDTLHNENILEIRNQLVLFLVSIFISLTVGICLYLSYYELMKYINIISSQLSVQLKRVVTTFSLGLLEILIFYCYKFCLILSRVLILIIFIQSFQLNIYFILILLSIIFIINYLIFNFKLSSTTTTTKISSLATPSRLIIIVFSIFSDLFFTSQYEDYLNLKRLYAYYFIYLCQNLTFLTYWLSQTLSFKREPSFIKNSNESNYYYLLVYLSILLLQMFGFILKFLHLHIIKLRYKNLMNKMISSNV